MRKEYIKDSFHINGVEVFDLGVEYVFSAPAVNGSMREWHLSKLSDIQLDGKFGGADKADLRTVLFAIVHFPNLSTKEAVEKYRQTTNEKAR